MSTKITIAGGSLAGLMTGITARAAGAAVEIHERSPNVQDDRGAGIVMQAETEKILVERCGLKPHQLGVWMKYRQYLSRTGTPDVYQEMPQLMTSWGLIYRALRSAFPAEHYHEGSPLRAFSQEGDQVNVTARGKSFKTDLLVGADGSRSFVRQQLLPDIEPHFSGYVAWRGVVPESSARPSLAKTFVDHFTFQQMEHSHILCYLIPGAEGEVAPGQRRINWVWYWNVPEADLPALMTGNDGQVRDFSVPPGQVQDKWLEKQTAIAEEIFCPQFLELWQATRQPFIQPILDLAVPRMVHGRVVILGDAAFIPRPHTAASTAKAGANALALEKSLRSYPDDLDQALQDWEPDQLDLGRHLERSGKALGNRSQFS